MQIPPLSADQRRLAVALVVRLTANTPLAPQRYERQLLRRFEEGELTVDELEALMEATTYQLLYHSQATALPTEVESQALLEWSRAYNLRHQLTGLLLYSEGRYVQLLEGSEAAVKFLFANIQQDTRHALVTMLVEGPGPHLYPDWSMAFGIVPAPDLEQTLVAIQVEVAPPIPAVNDPHLQKLLRLFL
jgi:hypothetical protein